METAAATGGLNFHGFDPYKKDQAMMIKFECICCLQEHYVLVCLTIPICYCNGGDRYCNVLYNCHIIVVQIWKHQYNNHHHKVVFGDFL